MVERYDIAEVRRIYQLPTDICNTINQFHLTMTARISSGSMCHINNTKSLWLTTRTVNNRNYYHAIKKLNKSQYLNLHYYLRFHVQQMATAYYNTICLNTTTNTPLQECIDIHHIHNRYRFYHKILRFYQ